MKQTSKPLSPIKEETASPSECIAKPDVVTVKSKLTKKSKKSKKSKAESKPVIEYSKVIWQPKDSSSSSTTETSDLVRVSVRSYDMKGRPNTVSAWVSHCN